MIMYQPSAVFSVLNLKTFRIDYQLSKYDLQHEDEIPVSFFKYNNKHYILTLTEDSTDNCYIPYLYHLE